MTDQAIDTSTQVRILYLDDLKRDIANFEYNIKKYNSNSSDTEPLTLATTQEVSEAIRLLDKDNGFDVFVCDHNMPEMKGLELITKYLKLNNNNLLFVLYTGAGNINNNIVETCKSHDIMLFDKAEEFSTLLEKIFSRLSRPNPNYLNLIYKKITQDIIEDMENTNNIDPEFTITIDGENYTPVQIISAVNHRTKFGINYVMSYIDGLKFFNKM
jgi:CheY-like chemotaxis protein